MNPRPAAAALAAALLLSGCAELDPPIETVSVFDPAEARHVLEPGTGTVRGQAFLRQRGGGVVTCAGNPAGLFPASRYAEERFLNRYGTTTRSAIGQARIDEPDPEYLRLARHTRCLSDGSFEFRNVPPGRYFVGTTVAWEVFETHYGYNYQYNFSYSYETSEEQGGPVMAPVKVREGETIEVVIP